MYAATAVDIILPASNLLAGLRNQLKPYWLSEEDTHNTVHWLISQHLSELGLFQIQTVPLAIQIQNHHRLLAETNWIQMQLYSMFHPLSSQMGFTIDQMWILERELIIKWTRG